MTKSLEKQLIDRHNLVGKSFGKWTVLKYIGAGVYEVACDCGHIGTKKTTELTMMRSQQCARCRRKELMNGARDDRRNGELRNYTRSNYSIRKEDLDE